MSNPGAADLQHLVAGGRPLFPQGCAPGGAPPSELAEVRAASRLPFLVPGVGAQAGDLERAVRAAWNGDEASCLVSARRSVPCAAAPGREAARLRHAIGAVLAAV